jgi:hypothetical protein
MLALGCIDFFRALMSQDTRMTVAMRAPIAVDDSGMMSGLRPLLSRLHRGELVLLAEGLACLTPLSPDVAYVLADVVLRWYLWDFLDGGCIRVDCAFPHRTVTRCLSLSARACGHRYRHRHTT